MKEKKFWNAVVIAILGGWFGLQHFYLRQTVLGVLGILFFWTGIPALVAFVEALVWLFDGNEEFNKKYNREIPYCVSD